MWNLGITYDVLKLIVNDTFHSINKKEQVFLKFNIHFNFIIDII